ncbi:hypothetical protein PVAP13_5KG299807 [Panicum virgatum]|uniref:Uncharacterized protein n=1 Tax=Panicum virgatum TaxID=38727 RepID=A0A8T0SP86_PANVG|nr:hypothetical protein PVAP13_5KG299807 [Panicum virgatum]
MAILPLSIYFFSQFIFTPYPFFLPTSNRPQQVRPLLPLGPGATGNSAPSHPARPRHQQLCPPPPAVPRRRWHLCPLLSLGRGGAGNSVPLLQLGRGGAGTSAPSSSSAAVAPAPPPSSCSAMAAPAAPLCSSCSCRGATILRPRRGPPPPRPTLPRLGSRHRPASCSWRGWPSSVRTSREETQCAREGEARRKKGLLQLAEERARTGLL